MRKYVDLHIDHQASTFSFDVNVREMANALQDSDLIAKLSEGDTTAIDVVYHKKCYTDLYRRYHSVKKQAEQPAMEALNAEAIAIAELISFIEEFKDICSTIFKLSELVKMYSDRLVELGEGKTRVNSTRLKERLLAAVPELEENKGDQKGFLSFNIADSLFSASKENCDGNALTLLRAAQIFRNELCHVKYEFNCSLVDGNYEQYPKSLLTLIRMILEGTSINTEQSIESSNAAQSITQLMIFNSVRCTRNKKESTEIHHAPGTETALPLYLGLLMHNKTRKRDLVDILFQHGVSVSYDRVLQVSADTGNAAVNHFLTEAVIYPTKMRSGLFTTCNLDNIDYNPSSNTAVGSFHGTAISITCHATPENHGEEIQFAINKHKGPISKITFFYF